MDTPIFDFVRNYAESGTIRMHMPGHKGNEVLGCEPFDITEVKGADALYEADGIIAQSEANATQIFGSRRTVYSTEGSSQCIRAMLYLAMLFRKPEQGRMVLAARNVHKAFVYAAALSDCEVEWLWPEEDVDSICSCPVTSAQLKLYLSQTKSMPAAVYVTSPDYLGGVQDIRGLAEVCHRYGTLLLVDNAHGAYLHFLDKPMHPLDLGADLCCDSAHKTLSVLTGGAYLHVSKDAPNGMETAAKQAMALFGSTSPSYLILSSLDQCNRFLAEHAQERFVEICSAVAKAKEKLEQKGWKVFGDEPMKLTVAAAGSGYDGTQLAERLRKAGIECEFADEDYLVLMPSAETEEEELEKAVSELGTSSGAEPVIKAAFVARPEQVCSVRNACFLPRERMKTEQAEGRVCAIPTVSCPPAIPIVVPGERIDHASVELLMRYGMDEIEVIEE